MRSTKSGRVRVDVSWKTILTLSMLKRELTKRRAKSLTGALSNI